MSDESDEHLPDNFYGLLGDGRDNRDEPLPQPPEAIGPAIPLQGGRMAIGFGPAIELIPGAKMSIHRAEVTSETLEKIFHGFMNVDPLAFAKQVMRPPKGPGTLPPADQNTGDGFLMGPKPTVKFDPMAGGDAGEGDGDAGDGDDGVDSNGTDWSAVAAELISCPGGKDCPHGGGSKNEHAQAARRALNRARAASDRATPKAHSIRFA
jgi:hypothetical protein